MSLCYPMQKFGRFGLSLGLTYKLVHDRFGFDPGERYHRDLDHRIRTTMEIDRAVFDRFGEIGLGFNEPFPRASIEPFGHRFMPAMYGCECRYAEDADPCGRPRILSKEEIENLAPWTLERLERSEPVRIVLSQIRQLKEHYEPHRRPPAEFCPHYRAMSSLQNLGSVINTAFSVQGQRLLIDYADQPASVHKLYDNITQLMLLCLRYFPEVDGWPLSDVFLGNCTVSMISPRQYAEFDYPQDLRIMQLAKSVGARFMIHQDSAVNPHLANYARFDHLQAFDLGQDTDFEKLHELCPNAEVNCILFPAWVESSSADDIRSELLRLMQIGGRFPRFSFSLLEVDPALDGEPLIAFCRVFEECSLNGESGRPTSGG
jgi:hypothetical protein